MKRGGRQEVDRRWKPATNWPAGRNLHHCVWSARWEFLEIRVNHRSSNSSDVIFLQNGDWGGVISEQSGEFSAIR